MGKLAFLFPGQGSQTVGMGRALFEASAAARAVFDEADEALSEKLSDIIFEGPEEDLKRTANTQPAILAVSIAALRALEEAGAPSPDFVAGHSLGEYSALVAAGSIAFADAVRAVRARGRYMQDAVAEGEGAMAAIMLMDAADIRRVVDEISNPAADEYVAVANFNGPMQTVIAGQKAGVEKACAALKEAGARKIVPLPVSAPFHCALMAPAQAGLADVLGSLTVHAPRVPVIANVDAAPNSDAARVVPLLLEQVVASVRFTEMAERLAALGVDRYVEIGPGTALIGMIKRMHKGATFQHVEDPASCNETAQALA